MHDTINKRIIGVIIIKDEWAVQSFGFNKYYPIGSPEILEKSFY